MLDERAKATLDLEAQRWKFAGAKEAAILERFGESPARYYQRLHAILQDPAALQYAPMTVRRQLRLQKARRQQRAADRLDG